MLSMSSSLLQNLSGSLNLDADSVFSAAICGGGSKCTNAASVVLNETLPCTGEECGIGLSHVKLDPWSPHTTGLRVLTGMHDPRQAFLEVETLVEHARECGQESFLVLSLQTLRLPASDL